MHVFRHGRWPQYIDEVLHMIYDEKYMRDWETQMRKDYPKGETLPTKMVSQEQRGLYMKLYEANPTRD